jgi:hypothetical protein
MYTVVTTVARGAVGFGSTGGGHEGAWRWHILEERTPVTTIFFLYIYDISIHILCTRLFIFT